MMQLFKNILIPTDFSQAAWNAVQIGVSLMAAASPGIRGQLTLLHIFPQTAKFVNQSFFSSSDLKAIDEIKRQVDEFCTELQGSNGVNVNGVLLSGGVEAGILDFVKAHPQDLIIMGVNSTGNDNQPGSHLRSVIEKVYTPVLVIPNKLTN